MSSAADRTLDEELEAVHLEFDAAALRLRGRTRWAGALVALATLLPYEIVDGDPQFLWNLAGELPPAGLVAYLAPAVAGVAIVLEGIFCRRALSLAGAVLAALLSAALLIKLGADASAWDVLPLPESVTERPSWVLLALAFTAAGANLAFRPHARRIATVLLAAAFVLAASFYLWPGRGEAPIATVGRVLSAIQDVPDVSGIAAWRIKLGILIVILLVLWPAIIGGLGLLHIRWPPRDHNPVISIVAVYGLPFMLGMFAFRMVPSAPEGWTVFAPLGSLLMLAGLLALLAAASEVAAEGLFAPDPEAAPPPGWPARRALTAAGATVVLLSAAQWALARPPSKGVEWTLGPSSATGDRLYGELIPRWNRVRLRWDRRVRQDSSAQGMVALKAAARDVLRAARDVDAGVEKALRQLTLEAQDLDVAGRRWFRLVADVNAATRAAALPYYLDPTVYIFETRDGLRRHFRMRAYRVTSVRRFRADGDDFATLHVSRLSDRYAADNRLGFSRDLQPFALVVADEVDGFETALSEAALESPPSCGGSVLGPGGAALSRCGELLTTLAREAPGGLGAAITSATERHELQHQIDGPHLARSGAVLDKLGLYNERSQRRVNRELSAYVAELTTPDASPQLGLIQLLRFALVFDRGTEHEVALLAFAALAGERMWDENDEVSATAVTQAYLELSHVDDDALRARAAHAWHDLFGDELPRIESRDPPAPRPDP